MSISTARLDKIIHLRRMKGLKKDLEQAALEARVPQLARSLDDQVVMCSGNSFLGGACKTLAHVDEITWTDEGKGVCELCALRSGLINSKDCNENTLYVKLMMEY